MPDAMTHRAHTRYACAAQAASASSASELLARHAGLVDRMARRVSARTAGTVPADDLWSAGAMGLLDAANRFDAARDVRFETFAEHRIRGAMLDELRRMDHLPRRLRAQADEVQRARGRLAQALQREPTTEELSSEVGLAVEDLGAIEGMVQPHLADVDEYAAPSASAEDDASRAEIRSAVVGAIGGLPERLRLVLSLHYVEGLTYREIARILDVSEPRVCQIHAEAMAQLRSVLAERGVE
jgi:RNA polymerase sigma factor for flagellar operon FliA